MAVNRQSKAGLISERTKAALAAAKQRGVKLGATGEALAQRHKAEAQARAEALRPLLADMQQRGLSLRAMAAELAKRKVKTP